MYTTTTIKGLNMLKYTEGPSGIISMSQSTLPSSQMFNALAASSLNSKLDEFKPFTGLRLSIITTTDILPCVTLTLVPAGIRACEAWNWVYLLIINCLDLLSIWSDLMYVHIPCSTFRRRIMIGKRKKIKICKF